ncbi:NAD(P)-binding domain-containing protein [Flavobacterium foetidum]|uniref:NAD(P)-binding domain-containing protein n=1 Tax=Flavobacterium foetidum TaxID=2026681 RepID=UPI001074FAEF|nr:NAD(P)-binding domain-containing protein [Flavobacterium foetidum]KAF2508304.1 NAD(P)-binding domain-containing protein [Flavobacterium foetidum]
MKIGIIGIGTLTLELARRATQAGYQVIINNPRGNGLVRETVEKLGQNAELASLEKATEGEILLLFIPKDDLQSVLQNMPDTTGKIIVHTSSLIFNPQSLLSGITNALTYKITAELLPKAHVVKLFNPVKLEKHTSTVQKDEIFFIAEHSESKLRIQNFLKSLNFSALDLSRRLQYGRTEANPDVIHSIKNYPKRN